MNIAYKMLLAFFPVFPVKKHKIFFHSSMEISMVVILSTLVNTSLIRTKAGMWYGDLSLQINT